MLGEGIASPSGAWFLGFCGTVLRKGFPVSCIGAGNGREFIGWVVFVIGCFGFTGMVAVMRIGFCAGAVLFGVLFGVSLGFLGTIGITRAGSVCGAVTARYFLRRVGDIVSSSITLLGNAVLLW